MGMLIEGKWLEDDAARRVNADGSFARPASVFRGRVAHGRSLVSENLPQPRGGTSLAVLRVEVLDFFGVENTLSWF